MPYLPVLVMTQPFSRGADWMAFSIIATAFFGTRLIAATTLGSALDGSNG